MSYGINLVAEKKEVLAIMKDPEDGRSKYLPQQVKDFIIASVSSIPDPTPEQKASQNWAGYVGDVVLVTGSGHEPGNHNLKIETFTMPTKVKSP